MDSEPVNIFWTGGWDSTFRVLQLLIEKKRKVQPHFVVRAQNSVGYEIKTMNDIRREIFTRYPHARKLLLPTKFTDIRSIPENKEIRNTFRNIKKTQYLANQYQFLARYCKNLNIKNMELSIDSYGEEKNLVFNYIESNLSNNYSLSFDDANTEFEKIIYSLFKYFRFPVIKTLKLEMKEKAEQADFLDILEMTWFCATPYRGKPCGFCAPCIGTIQMGLSYRVPFFRKIISTVHMPFRRFYRNRIKKK